MAKKRKPPELKIEDVRTLEDKVAYAAMIRRRWEDMWTDPRALQQSTQKAVDGAPTGLEPRNLPAPTVPIGISELRESD